MPRRTKAPVSVRMDDKGRLTIPQEIRHKAGLKPGDVFFILHREGTLHLARADNPFDLLALEAIQEHTQGETRNIEDIAREWHVDLEDE